MHRPLHDEDDGDKDRIGWQVVFDGRPDNLDWVWDTGLLEQINRNPEALVAELESRITPQDWASRLRCWQTWGDWCGLSS